MEKRAKNASRSVNQIPENNNNFDKDGKRETEKAIIREQLLEKWLRQKQLEEEVIKDMALQWGENSKLSKDVEATNESSNKPQNGGNLSQDPRRELEKRVIGEEILSSWLHRKQLEEEVMTELFGAEMLQRGKDSIASDYPKVATDTCNKPLTDLRKIIHAQNKGEGSGLLPCAHDPISLNGQAGNDQSLGTDIDGGLTGDLPMQSPPKAPNTTNPGMLSGFGKGAMTPLAGNDQRRGNDTDGGLMGSLPIQSPPRAQNTTNPGMFIGFGKGATTTLVKSVKECISEREFNADIAPIGGDNETAGKTNPKRKRWECDLCHVKTTSESDHKEHLRGKRHLAKLKASSETATPCTYL